MKLNQIVDAALRDEWDGLERINRDLRLADLFTILNAMTGLAALSLAASGEVRWAIHLTMVGVIMDGVDGAVARMGKGGGPLGGTLDTLADAVSFVTTPAVITILYFQEPTTWQSGLAIFGPLALYVVCGLLRLARFEALRDDGRVRGYFSGMPTPGAAMMLLALVLLDGVPSPVILGVTVYIALLMVSRIRYPKLRGWMGVWALATLLAVLSLFHNPDAQRLATFALLSFMAVYVLAGPFFVLWRFGPTRHAQVEAQ